jgi:3-methyladenine DNA glycosylase Tag
MRSFDDIHFQVVERFGSSAAVADLMPLLASDEQLIARGDNEYLSLMSRRIFRAGLKHSFVDAKWPEFERVFFNFNPLRVGMMSDDELEALMGERKIIRHWGKLKAVRANAIMLLDVIDRHGSVGAWLAHWPVEDITGLWLCLKKHGQQLGGNSAAYFLRMAGKDSMVLTQDVNTALIAQGIVDKPVSSQRDLKQVQQAFNLWHRESGWPMAHLSRLLSLTVNH